MGGAPSRGSGSHSPAQREGRRFKEGSAANPKGQGASPGGANGQEHLRNHVRTPGLYEGNKKSTQGIKQRSEKIRLLGGKVILITM